jgi:hypothetical protein
MENEMSVLLPEIIACAIRENDIEVLLALDNHDAIDMPNVEGDIPLVQCIKHDRRQIFELLLDYGRRGRISAPGRFSTASGWPKAPARWGAGARTIGSDPEQGAEQELLEIVR